MQMQRCSFCGNRPELMVPLNRIDKKPYRSELLPDASNPAEFLSRRGEQAAKLFPFELSTWVLML